MTISWLKLYDTEEMMAGWWGYGEQHSRETVRVLCFIDASPLKISSEACSSSSVTEQENGGTTAAKATPRDEGSNRHMVIPLIFIETIIILPLILSSLVATTFNSNDNHK